MALAGDPSFEYLPDTPHPSEALPTVLLEPAPSFREQFVTSVPVGRLPSEIVQFNHLGYVGQLHYDGHDEPMHDSLVVVREALQVVERNRERVKALPYHLQAQVDPTAYLVASTDGQGVTEWIVTDARWVLAVPYWKRRAAKVPQPEQDELILDLVDPNDASNRPAKLKLSRQGGVFVPDVYDRQSRFAWLIGEGDFATGPAFLDDPIVVI